MCCWNQSTCDQYNIPICTSYVDRHTLGICHKSHAVTAERSKAPSTHNSPYTYSHMPPNTWLGYLNSLGASNIAWWLSLESNRAHCGRSSHHVHYFLYAFCTPSCVCNHMRIIHYSSGGKSLWQLGANPPSSTKRRIEYLCVNVCWSKDRIYGILIGDYNEMDGFVCNKFKRIYIILQ